MRGGTASGTVHHLWASARGPAGGTSSQWGSLTVPWVPRLVVIKEGPLIANRRQKAVMLCHSDTHGGGSLGAACLDPGEPWEPCRHPPFQAGRAGYRGCVSFWPWVSCLVPCVPPPVRDLIPPTLQKQSQPSDSCIFTGLLVSPPGVCWGTLLFLLSLPVKRRSVVSLHKASL